MYLGVFLRQLGLSPSESSIIIGTMPFLSGFIRPLAGSLADKLRYHKLILSIFSLVSGVIITFMLLVPAQKVPSSPAMDIQLECQDQLPFVSVCPGDQCTDFNSTAPAKENCVLWCSVEMSGANSTSPGIDKELADFSVPVDFRNSTSTCIVARVSDPKYSDAMLCDTTNEPLCKLHCAGNITEVDECVGEPLSKFGTVFWVLWMLYFVGGIFYYPTFGLLDACTYQLLEGDITNWGMQRSFGTLGFAVLGFGAGYLMEVQTTSGGDANFTIPFMGFFIGHLILSAVTIMFKTTRDAKCDKIFLNALHLLKDVKVFALSVVLFVFGAFFGITEAILFWHLKTLGAPEILLGLSLAAQAALEFIMLFVSGPIISRIGDVNCIYIGSIAYVIRFVAYAVIKNPWLVLLPELLHCFTFGLFFASSTVYMASITPPGMKATVQNLVRAIHFSFGKPCPIRYSQV